MDKNVAVLVTYGAQAVKLLHIFSPILHVPQPIKELNNRVTIRDICLASGAINHHHY
jgi:hypothetical protein